LNVTATDVRPIDLADLSLGSFRGQPVAVLGLARSGVALARFLVDAGAQVTVYDARSTADLAPQIALLEGRDVRLLLGPDVDPRAALRGHAFIATSPSVNSRYPTTEPRLRDALADVETEGRVPVVSEIDLFLRLCPATTIGVTGTKGKTTTSSLAAAVLAGGAAPVILGGNIGLPLVERLPELTPGHRVVVELSELQLPTISVGTDVSVYTHVTSDHLDRHGTVEAYRAAKRRLAELTSRDGRLVLNAEDPVSSTFDDATEAPAVFYRRGEPVPAGVGVRDGWVVANNLITLDGGSAMTARDGRVLPLDAVRLRGTHNTSNVLAAVTVGMLFGVAPDAIWGAVANFEAVEHRLEHVATIGKVEFINDSQGTQPDAVIAALRSFDKPLVLICGGRSKNLSYDELATVVAQRTTAVVLIGETAGEMRESFARAGAERIEDAADLPEAVMTAAQLARAELGNSPGLATVLMSPAATSFDMFADYAARGAAFKQAVLELDR
jgi:UDP-N-acetylmuramoylalanine--D-glutamate ligase